MKNVFKMIRGVLLALCCLHAPQIFAIVDVSGTTATILTEASKTVMGVGEINNLYFTVNNPTNAPISGITVHIVVPAGCTVNSTVVPTGTTYNSGTGTWTFTSALAANTNKQLIIQFTYTGANGKIITPSATFTAGSVGDSEIDILIGCPFLTWSTTGNVRLNAGNIVQCNNSAYYDSSHQYIENLAPQGVAAVFSGYRQNTPVNGTPEYTARFQTLNVSNLGAILQFNNASPQSNPSGNAPYTIVDLNGNVDLSKITDTPPNFLQGVFTFDAATYPDGLNGISFFIYDIDATRTPGWQDAVIVYGTDTLGNQVAPITQYSAITTIYDILDTPYSLAIGGKCVGGATGTACLVNYSADDPRGRVTYLFPSNIRSFTIRYFRNSQINSQHLIYLSNIYRGCGTDLALRLQAQEEYPCQQCFTYTVSATNNGPSDVALAIVENVLPAGLTLTNATPSKGTFDSITGIWTIGSLTANPKETETLVMEVCATQSTIVWDMTLMGDGDQTVPGNNVVHQEALVTYIVVQDDTALTMKDVPVYVNWATNDSSVGGTLLLNTFNYTPTPDGTVSIESPGLIKFTPTAGFSGTATIPYTVSDSNGCEGSANIYVMVSNVVIYPPQAYNDFAVTPINTPVTVPVLLNDHACSAPLNPATVTIVTPPANGLVTNINPATGDITYTPNIGFTGVDSFVYQVCDTNGLCSQATVYVNVQAPAAPCPVNCSPDCCPSI